MMDEEFPRGFLLQWHLTEACNLRCRHCYQENTETNGEMPLEQLVDFLHQYFGFLRRHGIKGQINFTGGEPFLRDDLPALLQVVHRHLEICSYAILSNGSLIDRPLAHLLRRTECRFVQISVDGGPETHDALRGVGSYVACRRALRTLHHQGIPTLVSFTVSRANRHDFPELTRMAVSEGVDSLWSDRLLPLGRGREMIESMLSPAEVDSFFETMFRLGSELQRRWLCATRIRLHRALQFRTLLAHGINGVSPYRCNAGRGLLALMPEGTVFPCRRMPIPVGRLGRDSFEEIYREAPLLRALRNKRMIAVGCEHCAWCESCNGGLRCLAYACTGTPFRADPQCSLAGKTEVLGSAVSSPEPAFQSL